MKKVILAILLANLSVSSNIYSLTLYRQHKKDGYTCLSKKSKISCFQETKKTIQSSAIELLIVAAVGLSLSATGLHLLSSSLSGATYISISVPILPVMLGIATAGTVLGGTTMFLDDDSSSIIQFKQVTLEDAHREKVSQIDLSEYNENVDTLNIIHEHIGEKVISGEISSKEEIVTFYKELAREFELDLSVVKTAVQLVAEKK